jgi:hypothetical protein
MNAGVMKTFLWSGIAMVVMMIIAQGLMMNFIAGPSPALPAEAIAKIFIENKTVILIACVIQLIGWSFYATWAVPIIVFTRKMEKTVPALTYGSLVLVGGGWVFFILIPITWSVIAFRADTLDPAIIQIINDWVWFCYLYPWAPFSIWMLIIATAIFYDHNSPALYPRWVAYLNIWCAIAIFPAGLIGFFKTGPFAYDGLVSFWFAFTVFFGWMVVMTMASFRLVTRLQLLETEAVR